MKFKNATCGPNLHKLFKNEMGADVHFVLKTETMHSELMVPAHKAIFAIASPIFNRMFFGDMKVGDATVFKITDVPQEAFCEFLQFFLYARGSFDRGQHYCGLHTAGEVQNGREYGDIVARL